MSDYHFQSRIVILGVALISILATPCLAIDQDFDGNSYIDFRDYRFLEPCLSLSGPGGNPGYVECRDRFDSDGDNDVDLRDFSAMALRWGHLPIPLLDTLGNPITVGSTAPYSPRQTCATCHEHEADTVANGEWFQQGRTDLAGAVDMRDDYYDDGRYWIKSSGRYGKWGQSFQFLLAAKDNTHPSQIDETTFAWIRDCGGCHSGGGPGEFDRDGKLLFNAATGEFGYELLPKTPAQVALDGDYSVLDRVTGSVTLAPWDVTGLSEPDCMLCHRDNRPTIGGVDQVVGWRRNTLAAGDQLVDAGGQPVPAFAAAATAGQGWFSVNTSAGSVASVSRMPAGLGTADLAFLDDLTSRTGSTAATTTLQIDYSVGVDDGSLVLNDDNEVFLANKSLARKTRDRACVSCHPLAVVAGEVWYDDRDVHYRKFNNLNDEDPSNDIPPEKSTACGECHPTALDHNAAKGNSFQLQYRDELDYENFRTCRDCHLTHLANGEPNPHKHPDSPDVPGSLEIHNIGFADGENGPMRVMSCQACHIPYALSAGLLFRDITVPGNLAWTSQYLSAAPLDPEDADKSRWYPPLLWKEDSDGVERLFPGSVWINIYFGDWDQNGTPLDLSDDVIAPIYTWRAAQVVGSTPLPGTTDDDGDGRIEIDRPEEILAYFEVLKTNDANGQPVAVTPVLVRGPRVWYADPLSESGVSFFEHDEKGIPITSYPYIWGMDHNVLPAAEAWGAGDEPDSCNMCHRNDGLSPVFDRKVFVDPHGLDGMPEYTTVREMTKVFPFHSNIILKDRSGNPLALNATEPVSSRKTCGSTRCHDIDAIANGLIHQQGRTDADGNIIMKDEFYDDGRSWVRGSGMYGRWSGGGGGLNRQTAGKTNVSESEMDMTAFYWASHCGACHAGGGQMEFDRDGRRLWDAQSEEFGYEALGMTAGDVTLDGDYALIDDTDGSLSPAPWDVTGVAEPECLHCHRANRTHQGGLDMHREWRGAVVGTAMNLVDDLGESVPAFAAAGTAGQGWFSTLDTSADPPVLQLDYSVGVTEGSLHVSQYGDLVLDEDFLAKPPTDEVCWGCHLPGGFQNKRGTVWFDERDVHFKSFTNRSDTIPYNDLSDAQSFACAFCHPGDVNHNFAKGNSPYAQFRNEDDWTDFRSCRECHLTTSPLRHPDAPEVPGNIEVHLIGFGPGEPGPFAVLSCQACHVPYPLERGIMVTDRALTGSDVFYFSDELLSADPLDPSNADKSKWYPALVEKVDSDGEERFFPQKMEVAIYWADWDQGLEVDDMSDDTIKPIILWRVRHITGNAPLAGVTDDTGDGKLEVNTPFEMLLYMQALKGLDPYGQAVANNPVLVKGDRVWYEDPQASEGVSWFDYEESGIAIFPFEIFGLDHNVLVAEESWGYAEDPQEGCNQCHRPFDLDSPVFDRLILVDPFDETGSPVYETVRGMTGLNPP